jgi:hypothetical protein
MTKTTTIPVESPADSDPVLRLVNVLAAEGFTTDTDDEEWQTYGERIYRREEKISLARGETIFILTEVPDINEKIIRQAVDGVSNTYRAKSPSQKALSVLQSTTVYLCLISRSETPYGETLNDYITRQGGATIIPIIILPEINQVLYPNLEEKVGSIRPRVEYFQYLLGERRTTVNMHRQTVQAFYVSAALLLLLIVAVGFSLFAR